MAYSLSELPPPLSFISIVAIVIVYLFVCYLVIDLTVQGENRNGGDDNGRSGISREDLQDITCFYSLKLGYESTCAICLDCLQNAEMCRTFPACNHVFHARCIDPWLATHLTCPTCRAPFEVKLRFCT